MQTRESLKLTGFRTPAAAVSSGISEGSILSKSALDTSSISRTHPGTFMRPLYLRSWELELNFDVEQEHKDARSLKNTLWETTKEYRFSADISMNTFNNHLIKFSKAMWLTF